MSTRHKKFMRGFRQRLTKCMQLDSSHCGHEELVHKAVDYRLRFEDWVESQFTDLERQAVIESNLNWGPG